MMRFNLIALVTLGTLVATALLIPLYMTTEFRWEYAVDMIAVLMVLRLWHIAITLIKEWLNER